MRRPKLSVITFAFLLTCFESGSVALADHSGHAESETGDDADLELSIPIVLSVSRLAQPVSQAPVAVTVIDREMIQASGYTDLADVLRFVPGMSVTYTRSSEISVQYHGLRDDVTRRTQVLVDGHSFYNPSFGNVEWKTIPVTLDDVERIEVTRSPNSAAHGSNAFQGVINIITIDPAITSGFSARVTSGNNGLRQGVVRLGGVAGHTDYRLSLGYDESRSLYQGVRLADGKHIPFFNLSANHQLDDQNSLAIRLGNSTGRYRDGRLANLISPVRPVEQHETYLDTVWRRDISAEKEFLTQVSFHNRRVQDAYDIVLPLADDLLVPLHVHLSNWTQTYAVESQYTQSTTGRRLLFGAGIRHDRGAGPAWLNTDGVVDFTTLRLFATLEEELTQTLLFNAALMVEDNELIDTKWSPRLALNYKLASSHHLRGSYSRAYRLPSLFEEFADVAVEVNDTVIDQERISVGGIDAEDIAAFELGYLGKFLDDRLSVDVKLSYESLDNLVGDRVKPFPDIDGQVRVFDNSERARISAAEVALDWRFSRKGRLYLTHAEIDIDGSDPGPRTDISNSFPSRISSALLSHRWRSDWLTTVAFHAASGSVQLGSLLPVKHWSRFDAHVKKRVLVGQYPIDMGVTVQNVFNSNIAESREDRFFDRRFWATVALNY